jgi:hypothetical protein
MRKNTPHQFRNNAAAYRHFSKPSYPTTREIVATARRYKPEAVTFAAMSIAGFAAWFLIMWSL